VQVLDFRILGPLEVVGDEGRIPLGGQKQRSLLGGLIIRAGRVVSTDRLLDELWGEQPPKTATTSVQNMVSQLRKLLGRDVLVTRPPGYVLQVEPDQVDAVRFERLVAEARGLPAAERSSRIAEALALWRGPPLADLEFELFAEGEVRRLEELRLDALEERIEADLEVGLGNELVPELESLVGRNGLRERLRRELMLALYRAGRQAEALQVYHDFRQTLADELGVDPSPALKQVYTSILRQEEVLERAPAPEAEDHYGDILAALLSGRLVLVLGSGINEAPRVDGGLPAYAEVAASLAESFGYPQEGKPDLACVSQYVALMKGVGPLYDELHGLFAREYEPAGIHRALAETLGLLRERSAPGQLIVTANFDQALERALTEVGEDFDVVSYIALGRHRGKFLHVSAEGEVTVVDVPNTYADVGLERRTVILKIHGGVGPAPEREWDSFVVSEDDYIDYLGRSDLAGAVPVGLAARLRRSHFLFLGYPLRQWYVRVFLHRLWQHESPTYHSWAVQPSVDPPELASWRRLGIDVFELAPEEYAGELRRRLAAEPPDRA
jgi:DNA-binding SARP family transcriptional activator